MQCLIDGCPYDARNKLAVRCRKPSTRAVWAPDSEAYLCKKHAEDGVEIVVHIDATAMASVKTTYVSGGRRSQSRTTQIKRKAS